jgi:hypothetical protein
MIRKFAEIDANNKVVRIINADSKIWCESALGGTWVETTDGGVENPRANVGDTYDSSTDKFIKPILEVEE